MSSKSLSAIVSFSRELRNAREFKSISLSDISSMTRIEKAHLEAIESARWDAIPEGFLRGYIAIYSGAVGMNKDKVLRDFDDLISPRKQESTAEIVSNNPLLRQPERVGLTRAKIAAAWFADLTARTHLKQVLLILAIIVVFAGPAWLRNSLRKTPPREIPIATVISEYRSHTHGPQTAIPLRNSENSDGQLSVEDHWIRLKTIDRGLLRYIQDSNPSQELAFALLEDIKIQYHNELSLEISPPHSASIDISDLNCLIDTTMTDWSVFYAISHELSDPATTSPDTSYSP